MVKDPEKTFSRFNIVPEAGKKSRIPFFLEKTIFPDPEMIENRLVADVRGGASAGGRDLYATYYKSKGFLLFESGAFCTAGKKRNENFNDFFFEKFHFGACNLPGAIYIAANREFLAEFCG